MKVLFHLLRQLSKTSSSWSIFSSDFTDPLYNYIHLYTVPISLPYLIGTEFDQITFGNSLICFFASQASRLPSVIVRSVEINPGT